MDREQAVEIIERHIDNNIASGSLVEQALSMAIDALKAQLSQEGTTSDQHVATDTNVGDTISRQETLDALMDAAKKVGVLDADDIKTVFDMLPSAQPEPHEGEWINTNPEYKNGFYNNSYYCSECHDYYTTSPYEMKFCPNCGAKMKGESNE